MAPWAIGQKRQLVVVRVRGNSMETLHAVDYLELVQILLSLVGYIFIYICISEVAIYLLRGIIRKQPPRRRKQ